MDLKTLLAVLSRRKWIIFLTLLVALGLTGLGTALTAPTYKADATVRLATVVSGSLSAVDYELNYADRLMNTYAEIATSRPLREEVARQEGLAERPAISVSIPGNTELLKITATAGDAQTAANIANRVAAELVDRIADGGSSPDAATELLQRQVAESEALLIESRSQYESLLSRFPEGSQAVLDAQALLERNQASYASLLDQYNQARSRQAIQSVSLTVIESAIPPDGPSEPRVILNLILGTIAGLAAGIGLAVMVDGLDSTLNKLVEIESLTDAPVVGLIPSHNRRRLLFRRPREAGFILSEEYPHEEAFQRIRIAVRAAAGESEMGVLVVASSEDGEGKSTILAKLAQSYANSGLGVSVIDANTRSPSLEELCGTTSVIGLMDSLENGFDARMAATRTSIRGVDLISAGEASSEAADLLGSPNMELLLKQLKEQYDVVLIDTPGLLSEADAAVLAPLADGVLFIVQRGQTKRGSATAGLRQLAAVRANLVGIVVNGADFADIS